VGNPRQNNIALIHGHIYWRPLLSLPKGKF
jgi:hypothetical protein